jgi:positive regulator of sigma E activity
MDVTDSVGVAVGDRVQVAVPGGAVLKASFLVYGLPLLLLLIGVWLGTMIWSADQALRDLWSFLLGAGLAAAAVPFVRQIVQQTEATGATMLAARIEGRVVEALEVAD